MKNKAVNMTASVAYVWAGAVTQGKQPFGVFLHCVTNGPTDRPTDRRTHRHSDLQSRVYGTRKVRK